MRPLLPSAAAAGAVWALPALAPVVAPVAHALRLQRTIPGEREAVALTFDDGPDPAGTPAILEVLARHGAKATFFCVGEQVERSPSLVREIDAAGHGLAIHGHAHRCQLFQGPGALGDDLDRAVSALGDALGREPASVYRPPFGIFSAAGIGAVRRRGLRPVLWSRWGHDWRALTNGRRIARELLGGTVGGDVVLLHDSDRYSAADSWRRTAQALPIVLGGLEARGLRTRPL